MPPPNDPFELLHWNMINAHNVFRLGYQSVVEKLDSPPLNDLYNFLGYCEAWALSTRGYHYTQNKVTYPLLTQKITFSGVEEHYNLVNTSLPQILTTITEARNDNAKFDAERLKSEIVAFGDTLFPMLEEEADQMTGPKLKDAGVTEEQIHELINGLKTCRESTADPFVAVPFVVCHVPMELKPYWPEFPWFFRVFLIPYVFALRHSGYWKYAPYPCS